MRPDYHTGPSHPAAPKTCRPYSPRTNSSALEMSSGKYSFH
ncbi:MAG: hypothetical protein QOI59_2021, partial [Gammaproteobacteria bacterium]|nr:hypothetical protein [Gammaproteobacteria bacterium]